MRIHSRYTGFTLVELVIVIAVIGLLAIITIFSMNRFMAEGRDARRLASVTTIAEALEKYYDTHGEYPSCSAVTQDSSTIRNTVLTGIDASVFQAPTSPTNSQALRCQALSENSPEDFYAYSGDGSSPCEGASGVSCLQFSLSYKSERDGTIKTISSRRKALINTSGTLVLSGSITGYTQATVRWDGIPNALSYVVQSSLTSNFSTATTYQNLLSTSLTIGGLTQGTPYYFRVMANAKSSQTNWSQTLPLTTPTLGSPILTTNSAPTKIDTQWTSVPSSTAYRIEWALNASFSPLLGNAQLAESTTSYSMTGLSQGERYYVRVYATAENNTVQSASQTATVTTTISTPQSPVVAYSTNGDTTTWSWNDVSCPSGTTVSYATRQYQDDGTGWRSWTGFSMSSSRAVTTNYQGYEYRVSAKARCTRNSTSVQSAESAESLNASQTGYIKPVELPSGTATNFQKSTYTAPGGQTQTAMTFTDPSCGLGTTPRWLPAAAAASAGGSGGAASNVFNMSNDPPAVLSRWFQPSLTLSDVYWNKTDTGDLIYTSYSGNPYQNNYGPRSTVASNPGIGGGNTYVAPKAYPGSVNAVSGAKMRLLLYHACMNDDTKRKSLWSQSSTVLSPILVW